MTVIAAPAVAQAPVDDMQKQATELIKAKNEEGLKDLIKDNKKNASALASIAKAYLVVGDVANADATAQKAYTYVSENAKKATAQDKCLTYIVLGNIASAKNEAGNAVTWYQQAMYADPMNPDGYRLYATATSKSDPNGALGAIEELRRNRPDYPVDLIAADIANSAGKPQKAIEY